MEFRGSKFEEALEFAIGLTSESDLLPAPDGWNGHAVTRGSCGDEIEIWIKTDRDVIVDAACRVRGCLPSRACTVSAIELIRGKRLRDAELLSPRDILSRIDLPEDAEHCAVLAVEALQAALRNLKGGKETEEKGQ
ncbi:iron-sulfur cluster assembly scaffold protein [Thermodesulforhabdus norvegica]|uniref:Nitrogen fixation protein NifU n=1 Tax=Thermodesulforhabdus norvegica TaxID=39841 RepID=A0A1I4VTF3_9BACT|nr:iron-sulfur cluster assembly scaffold protein [Thermodesulforhabdus norvegica]SFN04276.1 nitrogen fixation protein NifU [Thermodesulforhabdus norvegica]